MSLSTTWLSDIIQKVKDTCLLHEQTGIFMVADIVDYPGLADRMFCVIPVTGQNNELGLLFCEDIKKSFTYEGLHQCGVMSPFAENSDETLGVHGEVFTDTTLTGDEIRALCNLLHLRYTEAEDSPFRIEESVMPVPEPGTPLDQLKGLPVPDGSQITRVSGKPTLH